MASPDDFRAVARRARRLARELPMFESVWVDALAQANVITAFQASQINAHRADSLRVGPYLIDNPLGSLQYAAAYAARHVEPDKPGGRDKPVRLIIADFAGLESRREAELLARLGKLVDDSRPLAASQGLSPIVAAGIDGHRAWAACAAGCDRTAARWMIHNGRFAPPAVLEIARQMTAALAELESHGIAHGDIRAQTILLAHNGRAALYSPGLRAVFRDTEGHAAADLPPEAYDGLAPQRTARGEPASAKADMFACGCLWWHLLTARAALSGGSGLAKMRVAESLDIPDVRPLAPDTPPLLAETIAACVARDDAARPESFADLAQLLGPPSHAGRRALVQSFGKPGGWNHLKGDAPQTASGRRLAGKLLLTAAGVAIVGALTWLALSGIPQTKKQLDMAETSQQQLAGEQCKQPSRTAKQPAQKPIGPVSPVEVVSQKEPPLAEDAAKLFLEKDIADAGQLQLRRGQHVLPKDSGRVRLVVPPDGLNVDVDDVTFERIDFVIKTLPPETTGEKPASNKDAIVDLRSTGAIFEKCTFSALAEDKTPSATALQYQPAAVCWTYPKDRNDSEMSLPSGQISFRNCVFQDVSAALKCHLAAAVSIRASNVLHLGLGPLVRLGHMPRLDEPLSIVVDRVTLRDSGPLLQCDVEQLPTKVARVSIETTASVLMPAAGKGLLVFSGRLSPSALLQQIEWTGQGSMVGEKTPIAVWRRQNVGREIDASAVSIAGLVRSKVEFAGAAESGIEANQITTWQAPIKSTDPPGVDVARLPKN